MTGWGACCGSAATEPGRFFNKTEIIAFSDPNDLTSYAVPDKFADRHIESRLCPSVTNVTINAVTVSSLLGLGDVANPLNAHLALRRRREGWRPHGPGSRVSGGGTGVAERCSWRETDESLMGLAGGQGEKQP